MVKSKTMLPGSLATLLEQVTMLGIGGVSETTGTPLKIINYYINQESSTYFKQRAT